MDTAECTLVMARWRTPGATLAATRGGATAATNRDPDGVCEEAALLLAVGGGNREAPLQELYQRYERRLYGLGVSLLGDPGLAEELVQETFLRLWRRADRFDPKRGSPSAFIFAIARRIAIDLWRRPSSRPLPDAPSFDPNRDDDFERLLVALTVRDALGALSPEHREVLELSYRGDLTQAEIATRLGVPLGTVKSRTYHALRSFKRALEERGASA